MSSWQLITISPFCHVAGDKNGRKLEEREAQDLQRLQEGARKPDGNVVIFVCSRYWKHAGPGILNLNGNLFWNSHGVSWSSGGRIWTRGG